MAQIDTQDENSITVTAWTDEELLDAWLTAGGH
jgi:hypothetical protein